MKRVFERTEQSEDFFKCISMGYVPLKFAFVGSAAYTHDRLALTAGYSAVVGSVPEEVSFLSTVVRGIVGQRSVCLVEFGPGNGIHAGAFYAAFSKEVRISKLVQLIDYSSTLLDIARARLEAKCPELEFSTASFDLEKVELSGRILEPCSGPRLALLLGNTIGNVESVRDALRNVRGQLDQSDLFAFGYSLFDRSVPRASYLESYRSNELRAAATEPLIMTGASTDSFSFELEFDEKLRAIVGVVKFDRPALLQSDENEVMIPEGGEIRCFLSRRLDPADVRNAVMKENFEVVDEMLYPDRSIGYVVCSARSVK